MRREPYRSEAEDHERARLLARAEATKMPWGKYQNTCFRDVPSDYLEWVVATSKGKVRGGALVSAAQWVLESRRP